MKQHNQQLKLLYLAKVMLERTDKDHQMQIEDIIKALNEYEIPVQRKTLSKDIELLNDFGDLDNTGIISVDETDPEYEDLLESNHFFFHIRKHRVGNKVFYYVDKRLFDPVELRILADMVISSSYITNKKSRLLREKLNFLQSMYEAKLLKREVLVQERVKTDNESIYRTLDIIQDAISDNKKISFKYFGWSFERSGKDIINYRKFHHDGARSIASPFAIIYDKEHYYMVAFSDARREIRIYRVDKMISVELTDEKREGKAAYDEEDKETYTKSHFNMFGGRTERVSLSCNADDANILRDKFGNDMEVIREGEDRYKVNVRVAVNDQFLGWLLGLHNSGIKIETKEVQEKMREKIRKEAEKYGITGM
jgi:predicted DNA-binding transcriptional regulator YafY